MDVATAFGLGAWNSAFVAKSNGDAVSLFVDLP